MEITRKLEFDAGHRLMKHESKCAHVHGHRYVAEITVTGALDYVGRVIDFSVIKAEVGGWIDNNWDHAMIVQEGDPIIPWLTEHAQRRFIMESSPTAENMASFLCAVADGLLSPHGVHVLRVRLYETPNCYAEVTSEE